jgi:hypothetical protein
MSPGSPGGCGSHRHASTSRRASSGVPAQWVCR